MTYREIGKIYNGGDSIFPDMNIDVINRRILFFESGVLKVLYV